MGKTIVSSEIEYGILPYSAYEPYDAAGGLVAAIPKLPHYSHQFRGHLKNGALVYVDGSHPEYSAPVCQDPFELLNYEKAGEEMLMNHVRTYSEKSGFCVKIFKNNIDALGRTWGCHENYMVERRIPFGVIALNLCAFNVIRPLWGNGRLLISESGNHKFETSQRAFAITRTVSNFTREHRALINEKDNPYADPKKYRRLHLIHGDSCMSDLSIVLPRGITAMILRALETGVEFPSASWGWVVDSVTKSLKLGELPESAPKIFNEFSKDIRVNKVVSILGMDVSSLMIFENYLNALAAISFEDEWPAEILKLGFEYLRRLRDYRQNGDLSVIAGWADWPVKLMLVRGYCDKWNKIIEAGDTVKDNEELAENNSGVGPYSVLTAIDLGFHDIDEEKGFYYAWLNHNEDIKDKLVLADKEKIARAANNPPETGSKWLTDAARELRKIICEAYLGEIPEIILESWKVMIFSEPALLEKFLRDNPKARRLQRLWVDFRFSWEKIYFRQTEILTRPDPFVSCVSRDEKRKLYSAVLSAVSSNR